MSRGKCPNTLSGTIFFDLIFKKCEINRIQKCTPFSLKMFKIASVSNVYYVLLVKDLPKDPGVAARMGFEPTTCRSKGIESTNVPPRPKNIGNCKKNY